MFYLFPTGLWLIILPANFTIDSLVLWISIRLLKNAEQRDMMDETRIPIGNVRMIEGDCFRGLNNIKEE